MKDNYVYFVRAGDMVKIGYSCRPRERMNEIAEWVPFQMELAATLPGNRTTELLLQRTFVDSWQHGEWFKATPELDALIASINKGEVVDIPATDNRLPAETAIHQKKSATWRITMAEQRAGIPYRRRSAQRPQYLRDAMESYSGGAKPPPTQAALDAIGRYEDEMLAKTRAA